MKIFLKSLIFCFVIIFLSASASPQEAAKVNWKKVKVLVYTKNGKGYVHDNVPFAARSIQKLGQENGFKVEVSDDPAIFTEARLKDFTLLIFPSTNNDVFDTDDQRLAFRRYIEAGGGFVGLHSVTGTERNWKWFKMMVGGTFAWHANFQTYKIKKIDADHPSVKGVPALWEKGDECYFAKELYPGIQVVMAHDLSSLNPNEAEKVKSHAGPFSDYYPAVWYQHFDGGNIWITALGHDKKDYENPTYLNHVLQGIGFVASESKRLDYSKAYATNRDTPLP
ncbi:MAG: Crp/Fnr family transcriptional regulator [Adhaeribacter sp.]|nr:Crp/Fnr family transcriptional regulator [Adhaeribacter sp.]